MESVEVVVEAAAVDEIAVAAGVAISFDVDRWFVMFECK